jgi:hypothetical protein
MAQKNRYHNAKRRGASSTGGELRGLRRPPEPTEKLAPVVYGKPFILLEDAQKNTFIYKAGAWVPHSASIAECRQDCLVKELPQRLNQMVRYEVRSPLSAN